MLEKLRAISLSVAISGHRKAILAFSKKQKKIVPAQGAQATCSTKDVPPNLRVTTRRKRQCTELGLGLGMRNLKFSILSLLLSVRLVSWRDAGTGGGGGGSKVNNLQVIRLCGESHFHRILQIRVAAKEMRGRGEWRGGESQRRCARGVR